MEFEYFTKKNKLEIYIEDRGNRIGRYAVNSKGSCVQDCLNKKDALALANFEFYLAAEIGV